MYSNIPIDLTDPIAVRKYLAANRGSASIIKIINTNDGFNVPSMQNSVLTSEQIKAYVTDRVASFNRDFNNTITQAEFDYKTVKTYLEGRTEELSVTVVDLSTTVGENSASIISNATIAADATAAVTSMVTTLSTNVANNYSTTSVIASTYATQTTVGAIYGVNVEANGHVSGYKSIATGLSSVFKVYAEKFAISSSSTAEGYQPFQVDTINHKINMTADVAIDGNLVVSGTIAAGRLDITGIFATNVTATGIITGATIKGAYGEFTVPTANAKGTSALFCNGGASGDGLIAATSISSKAAISCGHDGGGTALYSSSGGGSPTTNIVNSSTGNGISCAANSGIGIAVSSASGKAVDATGSTYGVYASGSTAGYFTGSSIGVNGVCSTGRGVQGNTTSGWGVNGEAISVSGNGIGVRGTSVSYVGIYSEGGTYDFYANGAGLNYGPFTGSHDAFILTTATVTAGDIVSMKQILFKSNLSQTSGEVEVSVIANDPRVFGVYNVKMPLTNAIASMPVGADLTVLTNMDYIGVNSVGEGQVNVCSIAGNIANGDYITSSVIPGKGMLQADDLEHSYTVAKALEVVDWTAEIVGVNGCYLVDGYKVKLIACTYRCG